MKSVIKKILAVLLAFTLVMPMLIGGLPGALAADVCGCESEDCTCAASLPDNGVPDSSLVEGNTGPAGGDGKGDGNRDDPDPGEYKYPGDEDTQKAVYSFNDDVEKKDDDGADEGEAGPPNGTKDHVSGSNDSNRSGKAITGDNKAPAINPGLGGIGVPPLSPGFDGDLDDPDDPDAGFFMMDIISAQSELIDPLAELLSMGTVDVDPPSLDLGMATDSGYDPGSYTDSISLLNNTSGLINNIVLGLSDHTKFIISPLSSLPSIVSGGREPVSVTPRSSLPDGVHTATITFSYTGDDSSAGSISVPITFTVNTTTVDAVTLDKTNLSLESGATGRIIATVMPENAPDRTVLWSRESGSENISVNSIGIVSIGTGAQEGETAIIRATSNADPTKYAECVVDVIRTTPIPDPEPKDDDGYSYRFYEPPDFSTFKPQQRTDTKKEAAIQRILDKHGNELGSLFDGGGFSIEDDELLWDNREIAGSMVEFYPGDGLVFRIGEDDNSLRKRELPIHRDKLDKYILDYADALGWKKEGNILVFDSGSDKVPIRITLGYMMNGGFVPEEDGLQVPDNATIAIGFITPNLFVSTEEEQCRVPIFKKWSINGGPGEIEWVTFTLKNDEVSLPGGDQNVSFKNGTVFIAGEHTRFNGTIEVSPGTTFTIRTELEKGDKMFGGILPLTDDMLADLEAQGDSGGEFPDADEWYGIYMSFGNLVWEGGIKDHYEKPSIDISGGAYKEIIVFDLGEYLDKGEDSISKTDTGKITKTKVTPVIGDGVKYVFTPDNFATLSYRYEYNTKIMDEKNTGNDDSRSSAESHKAVLVVGFRF